MGIKRSIETFSRDVAREYARLIEVALVKIMIDNDITTDMADRICLVSYQHLPQRQFFRDVLRDRLFPVRVEMVAEDGKVIVAIVDGEQDTRAIK